MKKILKQSVLRAKKLRGNATLPEQKLWLFLRKSQLNGLKFRRQQPIGKYIVDFLCCSKKIIIELDGGQHNEHRNIEYDKERDLFLKNEGYSVIRIWNNDILNNIDEVMDYLYEETQSITHP